MPASELNAIINKIASAGVVGAGGGGFPTAFKLKTNTPIQTVIINGAECEPLLKVDQELMARCPAELLATLAVIVAATGAQTGVIALKEKYREAHAALAGEINNYPELKLHLLPDVYPMGDEHLLTYSVTGKTIPPGGLPLQAGAVVLNVETLYNIHQALEGQPVTHKYVTVTGAVRQPVTARVPVGTPVRELLALAGGPVVEDYLLIAGGPCMGKVTGINAPVTKTTKGIIVLPLDHPLATNYQRDLNRELKLALKVCCQCMQCTDFCPRNLLGHPLEPHRVMRAVTYGLADITLPQGLLCSECGLCDLYACPFNLSPRQVNRKIKAELQQKGFRPGPWAATTPSPFREGRQVPTKNLISRLGLKEYYARPVTFREGNITVNQVRLPLKQSAGAAPQPVVKVGDWVERGALLARTADDTLGASLHASISGTIMALNHDIVIQGGGD
ncbi:4Fe-4S dicluster domain-containing protein [Neomoorella thermoacetica]|uniref:4Fe-4S dicluster domain-containing protein n=1 Tax=Neomoorella thermoacetica TaxID=1525 RepID=UPI0008FB8A04|nr:4Fe-4S dicluster domain-containing protein [Moorella thermoacetica]APC09190.1 electron transport complex subunit RsxC [Moorella thermoacetica]